MGSGEEGRGGRRKRKGRRGRGRGSRDRRRKKRRKGKGKKRKPEASTGDRRLHPSRTPECPGCREAAPSAFRNLSLCRRRIQLPHTRDLQKRASHGTGPLPPRQRRARNGATLPGPVRAPCVRPAVCACLCSRASLSAGASLSTWDPCWLGRLLALGGFSPRDVDDPEVPASRGERWERWRRVKVAERPQSGISQRDPAPRPLSLSRRRRVWGRPGGSGQRAAGRDVAGACLLHGPALEPSSNELPALAPALAFVRLGRVGAGTA